MESLELAAALRRQTLYPAELRAHPWVLLDSTKDVTPIRQPIVANFGAIGAISVMKP
jgi:hypothetical protein